MKILYGSIMDDDEAVMSHARESGLRFSVDQMLNTSKTDKQLIKELESVTAIYPANDNNISDIITKYIKLAGTSCSLNWIDTSKVTSMTGLFSSYTTRHFNGDISDWDVSNVEYMAYMFHNSKFNQDISSWDVSNARYMASMFFRSDFNGNISNWNVSNVKYMYSMFEYSNFNQDISNWNVSNVEYMAYMFHSSKFNQNISNWNVSNVEDMYYMFKDSNFNQDISKWNVGKVREYVDIFTNCPISSDHKPKFR